jgi:hypothetical protein
MNSPGRPCALDDARCAEICDLVADGKSIHAVARLVGCNVKTIRRHAARNPNFGRLLATAEISARHDPLKMMRRAAGASWRAAAWLLERTDPERFAKQSPATCRPADVDQAFTRIMDSALSHVSGDEPRRAMYQSLAKIMEEETMRLFLPPSVRQVAPQSQYDRNLEDQRLKDLLDSLSKPLKPRDADPANEEKVPSGAPCGPKTKPAATASNPEENANPRR